MNPERVNGFSVLVRQAGHDPSGLSGKEATEFAEKLVDQINADPYCKGFNERVGMGKTTRELNAYLAESGALLRNSPGIATKFLRGAGTIVTSVSSIVAKGALPVGCVFFHMDANAHGATTATHNLIKDASGYNYIVQPAGDRVNALYEQAERGELNNDCGVYRNTNNLQKILNWDPDSPELPDLK